MENKMTTTYKQTEIGTIPNDWETKKLGEICKFISGNGFPLQYQGCINNKYPFYKVSDFNNIGNENEMNVANNYISDDTATFLHCNIVPQNSIIIAKIGAAIFLERKKTVSSPCCIDNNMMAIVVNEEIADFSFIKYFLQTIKLGDLVTATALPSLSSKQIAQMEITLPKSKDEQEKIASILSDMDALLAALDKLIAKKKQIKIGAMQKLLAPQKDWETKKLGEIGEITGAGVDKTINENEIPVRLLNYLDVFHRDFIYSNELNHWVTAKPDKIQNCNIRQGDVFFTPSSEMPYDIAISAVAMEDIPNACYSYHINRFRILEEWDLKFKAYIFQTRFFQEQAETLCEGSGKRYVISLSKFREMKVCYPKSKAKQERIASILSDMDAEIAALERKREKYRQIKAGAMQQLLTGKVRLLSTNQ
jgi:type I restriction enzyme S subunit